MKADLSIQLPTVHYNVYVKKGLLTSSFFQESLSDNLVIITDHNVCKLYAETLQKNLKQKKNRVELLSFSAGDQHKTRATKEHLEDELEKRGFNRDFEIIAIGGGVVLDMAGFIAATYCRGVPFVSCPTSLLAMVDACIGGKTGVNTGCGKNRIGTFYHPKAVFMDLDCLQTLTLELVKEGLVEIFKHYLLFDKKGFHHAFCELDQVLNGRLSSLRSMILDSCCFKKQVIEKDTMDRSYRHILNFGHTIGHAIESLSSYTISHGRAVCYGLLIESRLAHSKGFLGKKDLLQVEDLVKKMNFPQIPTMDPEVLLDMISRDKKGQSGQFKCIALEEVGKVCDNPMMSFSKKEFLVSQNLE